MDVSIIVINYNTLKMTNECIESIIKNTKDIEYEIILVDNGSIDGSKDYFETKTGIKYVYSSENLGFGRGNNLGLKKASGRNILFLNSDTLLINNAIKILSEYLDENAEVGACGGNLYSIDGKYESSFERYFPNLFSEFNTLLFGIPRVLLGRRNKMYNDTDTNIPVAYICGADLLVKKKILEDVGGFNPLFFMYLEETELCYRISKNYKIMNVPAARIIHLCGGSQVKRKSPSRFFFESKQIYIDIVSPNVIYKFFKFRELITA